MSDYYPLLSIIGAGGHSRAVYGWLIESSVTYNKVQFVDPNKKSNDETIFGNSIIQMQWNDIFNLKSDGFLLGIGENKLRENLYNLLISHRHNVIGVIHKSAIIGFDSQINKSAVIGPGVITGTSVEIGENTIINSGALIEHETMIGSHCHLAPGVKIAGRVAIGNGTFIGIGAVVKDNIIIGSNVTVGAGAVVVNDIPDNTVVAGVPAKPLKIG